ncbi:MAG: dephospho-CoA kinase [Deltaproteobacteria bacterium]|jgi:dephospho-CoA kinase|nr:dephospho-CoA kinase [Deltaproteobacteria bacterium]
MDQKPKRPALTARKADLPPPDWAKDSADLLRSVPGSVKAALTGGLASGKSTVAALFEAFGASLMDFDVFSRWLTRPDGECFEPVRQMFGPKVLQKDGQLDRAYIAEKVFKDSSLRLALEDVIHPAAWRMMLDELTRLGAEPLIVIEVPLLFEAGLDSLFDRVILAYASDETQLKRFMARNPKQRKSQAKRRLASQMPMAEKIRRAQMIVDNNGSMATVIRQTKELWNVLTGRSDGTL